MQELKREKDFLNQKAYKLMNKLKQHGEIDQDWVTRDDDEIEKMHPNSLEVWVQNSVQALFIYF